MPMTRRSLMTALLSLPVLALARPARAATHTVVIKNFKFDPDVLNIAAGDTVVFENQDGAPHTATGSGFDTGRLNRREKGEVTITKAGTHDYICALHPRMKGRIVAK